MRTGRRGHLWHLYEVLGLKPENTKRIVFHEITKNAILHAIETPRDINIDLVNAQQARRILDRIVGFEAIPILWRKVEAGFIRGARAIGCRTSDRRAGARDQRVCLGGRLPCDR